MSNNSRDDSRYLRMADTIRYLAENWRERPDLAAVAARAGLSPWHFQRAFTRSIGISPKRFQALLALDHARGLLRDGATVLDAALDAGLTGPSRLHDLAVVMDAMSPGEIGTHGDGIAITYGFADSLLGRVFVATSARGIMRLAFVEAEEEDEIFSRMRQSWPKATVARDDDAAGRIADRAFAPSGKGAPLRLAPRGTNFQVKVWQALLAIPPGSVATYAAIAKAIGLPGAARAVGNACGANPVAVLIPCHRVLRETGALGGYAFGTARKRALLAMEAGRATAEETVA